jgi:threonine/homoserine/homoserine lactone efflux protein
MLRMLSYLAQGTLFGLASGFAPGPLLALVVAETLRYGTGAGIRVALAPLVSDVPIVIATLFLLTRFSNLQTVLGMLTVVGAFFVFYLGWENLRSSGADFGEEHSTSRSFRKGVAVNVLSPHPYLFWLSVGGPITMKAYGTGILGAAAFVLPFYLFLVGTKVGLAVAVGRSRGFLKGKAYLAVMRVLGLLLCLLALLLLRDGLRLLGVMALGSGVEA